MSLRRFSAREYLVNLAAVMVCMPIYARREWAGRPELDAFALRRARQMAIHAGLHVPAYRERYRAAGVDPRRIRTLDDLRALPLMDKATLRDGFPERSCAEGTNFSRCLLSTSSGSSGIMMTIPHRADRFWPYLISGQRMLRWAAADHYPFWYRQAYVYTSAYPMLAVPGLYTMTFVPTSQDPERILAVLERLRPQILHTYPTVLRDLVALAPQRMARLRLRGISVGSELSTQEERDAWEAATGAPVRDEYSSEELGRIASQCPAGSRHVHEDIVFLETIDEDGRPTSDVGEVVGTEFHNQTMPFVRYRQGDLARLNDERCRCGRQTRLLVDLVGRRNDGFVLRDGRTLPAGFLLDVCYRAILALPPDVVSAYRFVQRDPDRAVFELVPGRDWRPDHAERIVAALHVELPASLAIAVGVVSDIERGAGGKRSTIVRSFTT